MKYIEQAIKLLDKSTPADHFSEYGVAIKYDSGRWYASVVLLRFSHIKAQASGLSMEEAMSNLDAVCQVRLKHNTLE